MKLLVTAEVRLDRTPDGHLWAEFGLDYAFWKRYLDVFDEARVLARVRDAAEPAPSAQRADGPGVTFVPVPYFIGPWQYARRSWSVQRATRAAFRPGEALILRCPSVINTPLWHAAQVIHHPYGVHVRGDPYDVFAPGAVRSAVRPLVRWWIPRNLRRKCARAAAVMYVTEHTLQERYPPAVGAFNVGCSSIELCDDAFVEQPRRPPAAGEPLLVVTVGTLEQLYKGQDVLIRALAANMARDRHLYATLVGDGRYQAEMEELVRRHGLAERVRFAGRLPAGAAVRAELDRAALFVLPSRTEGLPRALIEAMARGLPCVASAVGGIPELLPAEDLVPPGDVQALAAKLYEVVDDRPRMARMAARNLERAHTYHADTLRTRRRAFYGAVRDATADWLRRSSSAVPRTDSTGLAFLLALVASEIAETFEMLATNLET